MLDENGSEVGVGSESNVWLAIAIGEKATSQDPELVNPEGSSFSLGGVNHIGDVTNILVLSSFSMREYSAHPVPSLIVDGKQIPFAGGNTDFKCPEKIVLFTLIRSRNSVSI